MLLQIQLVANYQMLRLERQHGMGVTLSLDLHLVTSQNLQQIYSY